MAIHVLKRARISSAQSKKVTQGKIEGEDKKSEEVHLPLVDLKAPPMWPSPPRCFLGRVIRRHELC